MGRCNVIGGRVPLLIEDMDAQERQRAVDMQAAAIRQLFSNRFSSAQARDNVFYERIIRRCFGL